MPQIPGWITGLSPEEIAKIAQALGEKCGINLTCLPGSNVQLTFQISVGELTVAGQTSKGDDRSVHVTSDARGSPIQTGDRATAVVSYHEIAAQLPAPETVDIAAAIQAIGAVLKKLEVPDKKKIERAVEDAEEEAKGEKKDREWIGKSLERALGLVAKLGQATTGLTAIKEPLRQAVAWLGEKWHHLMTMLPS